MIEINIDGKDPQEVIREVFLATYVYGQSVQVISTASSAAYAIASGAEAVAADVRQAVFDDWMASKMPAATSALASLARGIVPAERQLEPVYLVRHEVSDGRARFREKSSRKASRPRWRR